MATDCVEVRCNRGDIAARDWPGEIEVVLDGPPHERRQRFDRRAGRRHRASRGAMERHKKVGRDGRTGVIHGAVFVGEIERMESQGTREPEAGGARLVVSGRHRGPRAVDLLGTACARKCLQGMDAEPTLVRVERGEWRGAADVRNTGTGREFTSDVGNRRIRHAQHHQVGMGRVRQPPVFRETRSERAADTAAADDAHAREVHHGAYTLPRLAVRWTRNGGALHLFVMKMTRQLHGVARVAMLGSGANLVRHAGKSEPTERCSIPSLVPAIAWWVVHTARFAERRDKAARS